MLEYYHILETLKKELTRRLDDARFEVKAWECVKAQKKKDGGNFKDVARAFPEARYDKHNGTLSRSLQVAPCRWKDSKLCIHFNAYNVPSDRKEESMLMTIDEIDKAIREHVATYNVYSLNLQAQLDAADVIVKNFISSINALNATLAALCNNFRTERGESVDIENILLSRLADTIQYSYFDYLRRV